MFKKFIRWHKLTIGKIQNFMMINDYETLWLSWFKGLVMGIILMSLLSGCYVYEGAYYSDDIYQNDYYGYNSLDYYYANYAPTMGMYYWNNSIYWGYSNGWYYYYGYPHMYPWWYYYHYKPVYYYSINTHVYCHLGDKKYVTKPRGNRRLDNVKNKTYDVSVVNTNGVKVNNNSNAPKEFRNNKPTINNRTNTNTKPNISNRNNLNNKSNTNNKPIINNKSNRNNTNKINNKSNRNNINRSNSNKSNNRTYNNNKSNRKSNNRKPR